MQHTTDTFLLVRPSHFGFNPETAASNSFQNNSSDDVRILARLEFDRVVARLNNEKISTIVVDDNPGIITPDAIFPNNWISFHENNIVVLYPMEAPNRRKERRLDLLEYVCEKQGVQKPVIIDLTPFEKKGQFLEGTGSIVFDHINRIAYTALSTRTHKAPFQNLIETLGYSGFTFHTMDHAGKPVYHTNVVMSVGNRFAVVCNEVIKDARECETLLSMLDKSGHTIIEITGNQMAAFAGNVLEVKNSAGEPYILLSDTALAILNNRQRKTLEGFASLLPVAIPNIEKVGGGSIRCMVAEVFLKNQSQVETITVGHPATSDEMEAAFNLRWRVLRAPWGQSEGSERDDQEATAMHFIAKLKDGKVIGTSRLQEIAPGVAQLRYMAVDPLFHGKGVGRKLVAAMEATALKQGWHNIFLQSRENAVAFYQSCGYKVIEKTFLLYGEIQHYSMEKKIDASVK